MMENQNENIKGIDIDTLRKEFPHLYEEYTQGKIELDALYKKQQDPWKGYIPNYKDYLARAKTEKECLEIIDYLEKINEIDMTTAEKLRERTKKEGPVSFGTREHDYYTKFAKSRDEPI